MTRSRPQPPVPARFRAVTRTVTRLGAWLARYSHTTTRTKNNPAAFPVAAPTPNNEIRKTQTVPPPFPVETITPRYSDQETRSPTCPITNRSPHRSPHVPQNPGACPPTPRSPFPPPLRGERGAGWGDALREPSGWLGAHIHDSVWFRSCVGSCSDRLLTVRRNLSHLGVGPTRLALNPKVVHHEAWHRAHRDDDPHGMSRVRQEPEKAHGCMPRNPRMLEAANPRDAGSAFPQGRPRSGPTRRPLRPTRRRHSPRQSADLLVNARPTAIPVPGPRTGYPGARAVAFPWKG